MPSKENRLSGFLRTIILLGSWIFFCGTAAANEVEDQKRLAAIEVLSDTDNTEALRQLTQFHEQKSATSTKLVQLEALKLFAILYDDAGDRQRAQQSVEALRALALTETNQNYLAEADIFDSIRMTYLGKSSEALKMLLDLEKRSKEPNSPFDAEVKMDVNNALGITYHSTGNLDQALPYFFEALRLAELQRRRVAVFKIHKLASIANLYSVMRNPEMAEKTFKDAFTLVAKEAAPKAAAGLNVNYGINLSQQGKHAEAFQAYERAYQLGKSVGLPSIQSVTALNIADYYLTQKDYKLAETYARVSLGIARRIDEKQNIAGASINLGLALGGQGNLKEAALYINESVEFFKTAGWKAELEAVYGEIAKMYERNRMYKEAVQALKDQQAVSAELFQADRARAVASLQEEFDAEKNKKKIELLEKENNLKDVDLRFKTYQQIAAIVCICITGIGGVFIFILYQKGRKANRLLQEVNEQLAFHAKHDPLTGLHNRRSFVEKMSPREHSPSIERRSDGRDLPDCLILLDIDRFKSINDRWGHAAGDKVLKEVAARLEKAVRDTDMVLRWGGEEFLIFSPNATPTQITVLVDRLLRTIADTPIGTGTEHVQVSISAGFISLPFSGIPQEKIDWEKALNLADAALYFAKQNGRNRALGLVTLLASYESALPVIESDLALAIKQGLVEVVDVIGPVIAAK